MSSFQLLRLPLVRSSSPVTVPLFGLAQIWSWFRSLDVSDMDEQFGSMNMSVAWELSVNIECWVRVCIHIISRLINPWFLFLHPPSFFDQFTVDNWMCKESRSNRIHSWNKIRDRFLNGNWGLVLEIDFALERGWCMVYEKSAMTWELRIRMMTCHCAWAAIVHCWSYFWLFPIFSSTTSSSLLLTNPVL